MILDELVTDRTAADVAARNEKGTYNAEDLNRVGEAAAYVAGALNQTRGEIEAYLAERLVAMDAIYKLPYGNVSVAVKTDWDDEDVPTPEQMSTYLENVEKIKEAFSVPVELPETMDDLTYQSANNIELVMLVTYSQALGFLARAKENADKTVLSYVFSGETESGEL